MKPVPFNKLYLTGKEKKYIAEAIDSGSVSGNGAFTKKCHDFFQKKYGLKKCFLTSSCTDALEMAALLLNIKQGDEVIMPSFTFVSTANAFVLRGAKIIFADSKTAEPNIDENEVEKLVTKKTRAIVPVHYAGVACNMDKLIAIAKRNNISIVEDAAQSVNSFYKNSKNKMLPLGGIGDLGTFSFHDTKNITSGEGGLLAVNNQQHVEKAEIIWEKGTNRAAFLRGEINNYEWIETGSSFLPSDITAAFLLAQLEELKAVQSKRKKNWDLYHQYLSPLADKGYFRLPYIPDYAVHNSTIFYIVCRNKRDRTELMTHLKKNGIQAVSHYQALHKSRYYRKQDKIILPNAEKFTDCLLRLPLFPELKKNEIELIERSIFTFFN